MSEEFLLVSLICGITIVSLAAFPIIWLFTVWLISLGSGWSRFAEKYRAQQPSVGKIWLSQYGFVNGARYGNALNLITNETGISIEPMALFRFNHPRLFIPWSDMYNPTELVFRRYELVRVDVGYPKIGTISLPAAIFEKGNARKILEQSPIGTNVPT